MTDSRPSWFAPPEGAEHADHGRGTAEDGPDDPDCPCRDTDAEYACANAGCGFCTAARAAWPDQVKLCCDLNCTLSSVHRGHCQHK